MKKAVILGLLVISAVLQMNAQEDSYELKVRKMLELSGASENFNVALKNMLSIQKESYDNVLSDDFFLELEKEMKEVGLKKLIPKFIPIYKKYLTEEDLEGIIAFYESEVGKKLTEKTPFIINDAMQVGVEWGEEIGLEIYNRVQNSNEFLFKKDIEEDCTAFKEGTYEMQVDGIDQVFIIERKNNTQTEELNGHSMEFKITWLSNNKYNLTLEGDSLQNDSPVEVNIYEVEGERYNYIAKKDEVYSKGSIKRYIRKM